MKILEAQGTYRFINYTSILDKLEPGNYVVALDMKGYYLEKSSPFTIPSKIYDELEKDVDRYMNAYNKSTGNVGILLNGEKGSGKTLLANLLCVKLNLPVIKIEQKYQGQAFVQFINEIKQPCIINIDEYDKIYPRWGSDDYNDPDTGETISGNSQLELLKLMDSGINHRKLFILTSNDETISEYMVNRPSRIRYKQSFYKLSEKVIREVLTDKLDNKTFTEDFVELAAMLFGINLDTLLILVDEVNMMGISPKQAIKYMNIVPEAERFDITLVENGKTYEMHQAIYYDPVASPYLPSITFYNFNPNTQENRKELKVIRQVNNVDRSHFSVSSSKDGLVYTHKKDKYSLVFSPRRIESFSF